MLLAYFALFLFIAQTLAQNHLWIGQPKDGDWIQRHELMLNQTADHKSHIEVVFLGDSITEDWAGNGKEIWDKYYAPRHAYNYGISGDRTQHLIWRIENKEFDGVKAKVVVLKIGSNNVRNADPEVDIAIGIKEVINQLLVKMPSTKILLLGITPREGDLEEHVQAVNTLISKYNDDKQVFYLDMSDKFQDSPGKQKAGLYTDASHFTKEGYQVWYETMEPLFNKLYTSQ